MQHSSHYICNENSLPAIYQTIFRTISIKTDAEQNMFAAKIYIQKLECSSTKNMIVLYLTIYTCQIRFSLSGETKDKTLLLCLYRPHDCLRRHSLIIPYHQPQKVRCPSFLRWGSVRNHKITCTYFILYLDLGLTCSRDKPV